MSLSLKYLLKRSPALYAWARSWYPFASLAGALLNGRRGAWDHLRSSSSLFGRSATVRGRPVALTVEPVNVCNLRCPVCETGAGLLNRAPRRMTPAEFETVLGKVASHTNSLLFYFMGEPFLNPDAYRMIRAAKEAGIPWVTSCTNGEPVDPEQLVLSGLDEVSFQLGGVTQEAHAGYRVGGNLRQALDNLERTVRLRNERKSPLRVTCGMIVMRHNEHQLEEFVAMMKEMGVDEALPVEACVRTIAQGERYLPLDRGRWYYHPEAFDEGWLRPRVLPDNSCPWIYYALTVLANGDVVPCCRDARGEHVMGNLLRQELGEIWNGGEFRNFRRLLLEGQSRLELCRLCSGYPAARLR